MIKLDNDSLQYISTQDKNKIEAIRKIRSITEDFKFVEFIYNTVIIDFMYNENIEQLCFDISSTIISGELVGYVKSGHDVEIESSFIYKIVDIIEDYLDKEDTVVWTLAIQ